jgi:hypothetical protein
MTQTNSFSPTVMRRSRRTQLLARQNRVTEALVQADVVQALSQRADDKLLSRMVSLVKAELMLRVKSL